ncbi:MAG: GTP-binding protein, HSR1-related [Deltaproteobacteria bacterium]|jgi:GTP-binding protein HflX|nr:GTP-binding protein, HSR1-related [Deltaproteobacteria bacterium]
MHADPPRKERALLVYAHRKRERGPAAVLHVQEVMAELAELVRSAGAEVAASHVQSVDTEVPGTVVGKGTLGRLKDEVALREANLVVFQNLLRPKQQARLTEELGVKTLDRREVILDIFAQRARTKEGKLQVELAQLSFRLGRLAGGRKELSRLGGGIGTRGPGEKKLEEDRRRIRAMIRQIGRELETVRRTRSLHYRRRREVGYPVVALVGYTNAGKSTLFNRMTGAEVFVADQLFATLDPTARKIRLPGGREAILVDTVGFIHDLPEELRQAFLATLEGIGEADLLIHVADGSAEAMESNIASVDAILSALSFGEKPALLAVNKRDLCFPGAGAPEGALRISARTGEGVPELTNAIEKELSLCRPEETVSTRPA